MKFQQVMAFFLTGATALSISTTALAVDLPDNVDITCLLYTSPSPRD